VIEAGDRGGLDSTKVISAIVSSGNSERSVDAITEFSDCN